jgi:hypothetical protein
MAAVRLVLRLAMIGLVVWAVHWVIVWLEGQTHSIGAPQHLSLLILLAMLAAYALLIAIPFVPGIEIGLALMLLQGRTSVPLVYLATVLGLMLAYTVGARLGYPALDRLFADLRLHRAGRLLDRIAPLTPAERLDLRVARLPGWLAAIATRYRYVVLGLCINVPGNGVLGGGGGLALLAGFSKLYSAPATILTFLIAVAPVPMLFWVFGRPVLPLPGL